MATQRPTPSARAEGSTPLGKAGFALAVVVILALITVSAIGALAVMGKLTHESPLSSVVPEDGRMATAIGALAMGGVVGLFVPLTLIKAVKGSATEERTSPSAAAVQILGFLGFAVYVGLVSLIVAQLGRLLPAPLTGTVAVFAVGFSWIPLALVPWDRIGLGGLRGALPRSRKQG
ncbi:hypothetical protein [Streptomyces sp. NPDC047108]|uniref:hypothetical protein n=1 Tax=Streptomyces sp. NPDC047108 TaxID=3155025 RepID=UPI0033C4A083